MLDRDELHRHFTEDQVKDLLDLIELCEKITPGRIRRSRVRKINPNHIPRPINSFMTYRTEKQALIRKFCPTANHRDISRMVAKWWHNLDSSQKSSYVEQAKNAKIDHIRKYPDYTFRPKPKKVSSKAVICTKKNPKVKVDELEIDQLQSCLIKPETDLVDQTPCDSGQHRFHSTAYYTNSYNFAEFANHTNVHPNQTLQQVKGNNLGQIYCYQQPFATQYVPSPFPVRNSQEFYYGQAVSYYPSPVDKSPSVTLVQTTCNPSSISDSISNLDQTYSTPILDDEITPLSQTMGTPVLGYPSTPFVMSASLASFTSQRSQAKNSINEPSCFYEDFSLYSELNPDVKSAFTQDCEFWGSSTH